MDANYFLNKPVTDDNIRAAQNLFDNFIYDIPELYGREHVSYNIHILQHIPQTVKNWGAPSHVAHEITRQWPSSYLY